jgi:hypothetical protein
MAPAQQARAHLAALEYMHVEATVERGRRGLKADRAGADNR